MKKIICLIMGSLVCVSAWGDWGMFLFKDNSCASQIESRAGFFTAGQCAEMLLTGEYQQPTLTKKDIRNYSEPIFLVVALRNTGNFGAWGTIRYSVVNGRGCELEIGGLPANAKKPHLYILQRFLSLGDADGIPQVNVDWVKLYKK